MLTAIIPESLLKCFLFNQYKVHIWKKGVWSNIMLHLWHIFHNCLVLVQQWLWFSYRIQWEVWWQWKSYYRAIGVGVRIGNVGQPNILVPLPPTRKMGFLKSSLSALFLYNQKLSLSYLKWARLAWFICLLVVVGLFSALGIEWHPKR